GKGGSLKISTGVIKREDRGDQREYVRVAFSDTGGGIDPSIKNKIFEHFFSTKESGTGLGLAVVNRVIKTHDGFIELESDQGRGSTFFIHLPIDKEC
ncbi:MAG: ATP-binding protein, partial [bacterium]